MSLVGKHILVTAGPTHEPIDPVRVIANRSSGRQGFAIAAAAAEFGAQVTLIAGPVTLETPSGVKRIDVETAEQMADAVMASLPVEVAILVAAVADWRVHASPAKLKKGDGPPQLRFEPTRDILAELPFGNKLKMLSAEEVAHKQLIVEGIMAIQAGVSPRVVEQLLKSRVPPSERDAADAPPASSSGGGSAQAAAA